MESTFSNLSLSEPILRALSEQGYSEPTPVQAQAIPELLAGKDLLATAQTGTGKTAAFSLPILELLAGRPKKNGAIRALILTPTRELALQIDESLRTYGRHLPLRSAVILGGVKQFSQVRALRKRPEILVATPGRLLDLKQQGLVRLDGVEMFVLDEADRMLDMGFLPDVRRVISMLPSVRQTMLFSATMEPEIAELASGILQSPVRVEVARSATVAEKIDQKVFFVDASQKRALLTEMLKAKGVSRALVFTRTKHRANSIVEFLETSGIRAEAIHSNKSQNARQRALAAFSSGKAKVLVATDIVARGIDVDGITHVVNYELPNEPESYVHRIGRTARAGAAGTAVSFCDAEELAYLADIERLTKSPLDVVEDQPYHSFSVAELRRRRVTPRPAGRRPGGRRGGFRGQRRRGPARRH